MTKGTISCVRPVQSYGRLTTFSGSCFGGVARLHGHMYCTKLDTMLVREMLPLSIEEAPLRVLILSPFTSDETAYSKLKIAATKKEYIVNPEQIKKIVEFWKYVKNPVMQSIRLHEENLKKLREVKSDSHDAKVSPEMVEVSYASIEKKNKETQSCDGGPSLLRSNEEMDTAVFMASTVTLREVNTQSKSNSHQEVVDVLQGSCYSASQEHSSNTYAVRPLKEYANETDGHHLEAHFPDIFIFGRAGWIEPREKPISKPALGKYHLNISGGQFQGPDFILHLYDLLARNAVKTRSFVRAKLPSHYTLNGEGIPKAEIFGKVSLQDMTKAAEYKKQCFLATKRGKSKKDILNYFFYYLLF